MIALSGAAAAMTGALTKSVLASRLKAVVSDAAGPMLKAGICAAALAVAFGAGWLVRHQDAVADAAAGKAKTETTVVRRDLGARKNTEAFEAQVERRLATLAGGRQGKRGRKCKKVRS